MMQQKREHAKAKNRRRMYSLETVWPNMSHLDKVRIQKQRKTKQSGGALTINCVNKQEYINTDKLQEVLVGNRLKVFGYSGQRL